MLLAFQAAGCHCPWTSCITIYIYTTCITSTTIFFNIYNHIPHAVALPSVRPLHHLQTYDSMERFVFQLMMEREEAERRQLHKLMMEGVEKAAKKDDPNDSGLAAGVRCMALLLLS